MAVTKRGIFHNLKESTYCVTNGEIILFFSSRLYMQKFIDGYEDYRETFNSAIGRVTNETPLNMDILSDVSFYKVIEKRGFRSLIKGIDITWQDLHKYALRKMIEKNTPVWQETQKPKLKERLKIME